MKLQKEITINDIARKPANSSATVSAMVIIIKNKLNRYDSPYEPQRMRLCH